jgi:hypothetical protein
MKTVLRFAAVAIAAASIVSAQDLRTATVVGNVSDASGASVANASVTVTNIDTNTVARSKSNAEGAYYVPFLIAGRYRVEVEAPGFKRSERDGLLLNAGETPRIDIQLVVGAVTEEIKITAQASLLDTDNAVVGGITNAKDIHDTPIPQSKPQHFMYYQNGRSSQQ